MLKILFACSEIHPLAATGGLGEVCASLPVALPAFGCDCRAIIPGYRSVRDKLRLTPIASDLRVPGWPGSIQILRGDLESGLAVYVVDVPELFNRPGSLYAAETGTEWPDNPFRFAIFSRVVAALATGHAFGDWRPDLVHCHDWQTGLVPALLQALPRRPATVFTIHNLSYLGQCDYATFQQLELPGTLWHLDALEFYGSCALIKGGIRFADAVTTVSPNYAREIQTPEFGHGLDGLLRARSQVLSGILNGIDYRQWNPAADRLIAPPYDADRLDTKAEHRRALCQEFGLRQEPTALLLGAVSRLTEQKGIDLAIDAFNALAKELPLQLVLLGSGEQRLQDALRTLAQAHAGRVGLRIGYDEALAHRIIAGSDALLMPSRFEPCGLTQLCSQRYGTPPIARRTGGLADSIDDSGNGGATGFLFDAPSTNALAGAIRRAHASFRDTAAWRARQRAGMARDFSWVASAALYRDIYRRLLSR
ncbi:MAG: glycogen synthase GlgA [Gammaproteobacteria bacterium]|nr:glycogen synthase GlgA [Gammaproteobacteria bacterium]